MKSKPLVSAFLLLCNSMAYPQYLPQVQVHKTEASMNVRVYNYAHISGSELNLSQSVASEIFRESGIEIRWYDCGPSANADGDPYCSASTQPETFNLRICNNCTDFLKTPEHEVRGFVTGETATVSSTWNRELPTANYVSSELILGRVIAHELGHILLGPGHSPVGIMKAHWTANDLDPGKLGMLVFTKKQGTLIRSALKSYGVDRTRMTFNGHVRETIPPD